MIRLALLALVIVLMLVWIFLPVWRRWRDHLKDAPEVADANFRATVLLAFKGLRTKMFARLMDAIGVAVPAVNAIGEFVGAGGIDLNGFLPSIPLGKDASGASVLLSPSQYSPLIFLAVGRITDWLRNHTSTPPGMIDPALAVAVATDSKHVDGSEPSDSIKAICAAPGGDPDEPMRLAGGDRQRRKPHKRRKS